MSSSVATCSFPPSSVTRRLNSRLGSKNPGLSLSLGSPSSSDSAKCTVIRRRSSVFESLSNTPALEPSTDSDSDSDSDCEDDGDDVQYVYIPADSPFHRNLSTPRSAAHTSFTGFPFACDALAEEDPLFVSTPGAWFDEELQRIVGDDADSGIVVWDNGSLSPRSQCPGWPSLNTKDAYLLPEYVRQSPMVFDDDELRQYL